MDKNHKSEKIENLLNHREMRLAERDYKKLFFGNPMYVLSRRCEFIDRTAASRKLNFSHSIGFKVFVDEFLDDHSDLPKIDAIRRAKCIYKRMREEFKERFRQRARGEFRKPEEEQTNRKEPESESQYNNTSSQQNSQQSQEHLQQSQHGNEEDSQEEQKVDYKNEPDSNYSESEYNRSDSKCYEYETESKQSDIEPQMLNEKCCNKSEHQNCNSLWGSSTVSNDGASYADRTYKRKSKKMLHSRRKTKNLEQKDSLGFNNYYKMFLFYNEDLSQSSSLCKANSMYKLLTSPQKARYRGYGGCPRLVGVPRSAADMDEYLKCLEESKSSQF